jgi:hypothetical protein
MSVEAARYRVRKGIALLDKHVPGWRVRVVQSDIPHDIHGSDYDVVGLAVRGRVINGVTVYTSTHFCRALNVRGEDIGTLSCRAAHVGWDDLQAAWSEALAAPLSQAEQEAALREELFNRIARDLGSRLTSRKYRRLMDCGCPRYSRIPLIDRALRWLFPPPVHS